MYNKHNIAQIGSLQILVQIYFYERPVLFCVQNIRRFENPYKFSRNTWISVCAIRENDKFTLSDCT